MLWAAKQLLTPCKYLAIRQGEALFESKTVYDFVFPAVLTVGCLASCWWLGIAPDIHKHPSLVKSLSDLLTLLIAFYMAALAAVATFDRKGMDLPLRGGDAILMCRHPDGGEQYSKKLSYRQFISYLFGYLAFLSIILFVLILFSDKGWPHIATAFKIISNINGLIAAALFVGIIFEFFQILTTSLLGIYFLAERIQTISEP